MIKNYYYLGNLYFSMDNHWSKIFDNLKINPFDIKKVGPRIANDIFKKLKLNPARLIPLYNEKHRTSKIGDIPDLWPLRSGIGTCVLIKGDMSIWNNYPNEKIIYVKDHSENVSTNINYVNTERESLVQAYNIGVFQKLTENDIKCLGIAGKLYLTSDIKYYERINLNSVQFELDWSVETDKEILLFEAKRIKSKGKRVFTEDFVLFQIFFPAVYASQKTSKKIRPFFLDIIDHHYYVDYHFIEIKYDDVSDLASYDVNNTIETTIRVEKL